MLPLDAASLQGLALGDIVTLPPAQSLSVRVSVALPENELALAGFIAVGELEMLLASSHDPRADIMVFQPVDYLPPQAQSARILAEGAAAYWAPHLPSHAGGMGEVYYRLLLPRGSVTPMVLMYRGPELVVFVHVGAESPSTVQVLRMPRGTADEATVARVAAVVEPLPVPLPAHVPTPTLAPSRR